MGSVTPIPTMSGVNGKQVAILGTSNDWDNFSVNFVSMTNAWLAKGGIVMVTQEAPTPSGAFSDIYTPGTAGYSQWTSYLNAQIAKFKQINGTVIWRPWTEPNGNHFGHTATPAQFAQAFRFTHDYCVSHGLNNVLWEFNLNNSYGGSNSDYYPGGQYVDIVSVDAYPPTLQSIGAQYSFFLTTGKPIIIAETGKTWNNAALSPGTYDNSIILNYVKANFPKVIAIVFWCQNMGLNVQNGTSTVMNDPAAGTLADLPVLR